MDPPPPRPINTRQSSKIPGGFDTDDELSPTKTIYDDAHSTHSRSRRDSHVSHSDPMPAFSDEASFPADEGSSLDEREMSRKLMDIESSFMPDASPETAIHHRHKDRLGTTEEEQEGPDTPPTEYKTPAQRQMQDDYAEGRDSTYTEGMDTSMLETMSSSPTAAAAARTVSRVVSMVSMGGYETAAEDKEAHKDDEDDLDTAHPNQSTPRKDRNSGSDDKQQEESTTPTAPTSTETDQRSEGNLLEEEGPSLRSPRRRPKYLSSRYASQRSSYSSYTNTSVEEASELTVGLQTGSGLPGPSSSRAASKNLSRTISLGSMASGISNLSDGEGEPRSIKAALDLGPLPEESPVSEGKIGRMNSSGDDPKTPQGPTHHISTPTDTVINQRVQDFEVPGTIARRFQDREGNPSPERRPGAPTPAAGRVKNLTLKEQSGLIDKLQKENWKLKLKLYFMDQTMAERSDESVKAMISENVELKTLKFSTNKEIRALKRSIRELEFKLKERDDTINGLRSEAKDKDRSASGFTEGSQELETEVTYLRGRVETYEVEIEKLRSECTVKEGEKRRLAEMVKKAKVRQGSDVEAREEVELWKDLLEAETARKEQTDEENRQLREELWRLKEQKANSTVSASKSHDLQARPGSSRRSDSSHADGIISASNKPAEQLRHENAELRRDLRAQTSMLTSRNNERDRLYAEIEDLKMRFRQGDSILDRSVSRAHARSSSRTSSQTRITQIGDAEREAFETANGELRDQIAGLKLENQELARQLDGVLDELEQLGNAKKAFDELQRDHNELTQRTDEELLTMQAERDEALSLHEEAEISFQELKSQAQEQVDELEDELDRQTDLIKKLERELAVRDRDSENLRNEVRMTADGLARVEADSQAKVQRIGELQHHNGELELQNEDLTQELETIEDSLNESNSKVEKLTVELESRVSECAFLREEQDGTMLRIGDLENDLKASQASLTSEKDKTKDLETRLADERHQRELIGSQEKQEVQKKMNQLNEEAATSQDEVRKLRKAIEHRETEVKKWQQRLFELESGLKEVLGDSGSSKTSHFSSISRIQRELESTRAKHESTQHALSEKERLLQRRDALLETHGLESRKLSELLEKERAARRADEAQREQWQKTHQHTSRTVSQKDARINELEQNRSSDRKRLANLENQFRDQLQERNALLLSLWSKLSALCGTDWQHQHSLVSGHLPTLDVVTNMLPAFSKNLLSAVKAIDGMVSSFRARVKSIERDLNKDYQQLEHNLDLRIKRLDRLESAVQVSKISGAANAAPEIAKLRGENRLLKSDIQQLQQEAKIRNSRLNHVSIERAPSSPATVTVKDLRPQSKDAHAHGMRAISQSLTRGFSTSAVETTSSGNGTSNKAPDQASPNQLGPQGQSQQTQLQQLQQQAEEAQASNMKWIHRLRELERRLKVEREGRVNDRNGATKRLRDGIRENEELKAELEREKERRKAVEGGYEGDKGGEVGAEDKSKGRDVGGGEEEIRGRG